MTTTPRRRSRRGAPPRPVLEPPSSDPVKDRTVSIITSIVFFVIFAFVLIPVVWALVHGYRWAIR